MAQPQQQLPGRATAEQVAEAGGRMRVWSGYGMRRFGWLPLGQLAVRRSLPCCAREPLPIPGLPVPVVIIPRAVALRRRVGG